MGISISVFNILLLPLDVSNQKGVFENLHSIPMGSITISFFIITIVMGLALVPFAMFYYEGIDETDTDDGSTYVISLLLLFISMISICDIIFHFFEKTLYSVKYNLLKSH